LEDNWRPLEGAGRVTRVREGSDGMVDGESLPDLDDAGHKRGGGDAAASPSLVRPVLEAGR
jgi:hypothetical protein